MLCRQEREREKDSEMEKRVGFESKKSGKWGKTNELKKERAKEREREREYSAHEVKNNRHAMKTRHSRNGRHWLFTKRRRAFRKTHIHIARERDGKRESFNDLFASLQMLPDSLSLSREEGREREKERKKENFEKTRQ